MSDLLAVVLVCAATLAPPDCTRSTALDVTVLPVPSQTACLQAGQMRAAQAGQAGAETYVKVVCERRRPETREAAR